MSHYIVKQHTTITLQPKQTHANKHYVENRFFTFMKTKTTAMEELLKVHRELLLYKPKTYYSCAFFLILPPNFQFVNANFCQSLIKTIKLMISNKKH